MTDLVPPGASCHGTRNPSAPPERARAVFFRRFSGRTLFSKAVEVGAR